MAWIRTLSPEEAQGELRLFYEAAERRAGRVFQILRVMSLAPKVLEASIGVYLAIMHARGALTRRQRELLAVVTSTANHCHY
jgi:alkylhydroperoxidase family enzyme